MFCESTKSGERSSVGIHIADEPQSTVDDQLNRVRIEFDEVSENPFTCFARHAPVISWEPWEDVQ